MQQNWDLPGFRLVCKKIRKVGIILRLDRAELALLGFAKPNASMRILAEPVNNVGICKLLGLCRYAELAMLGFAMSKASLHKQQ